MKYDVDGINLKKELKLYRMELDLNEEPWDPTHSVVEFDSILDELESANGDIHDRIRHLEAVISRARQRQRWPTGEATANNAQDEEGMEHQEVEEGIVESGKVGKGKGSDLIAKALGGVETDACKAGGSTGNTIQGSQSRLGTDSNQHTVSHPVSRLLVQGVASFSSLSSA
ncbi:uncharacterized protein LOC133302775 isoform X2 [Gastrolobium bilobum]|nr:uncharacterized protein LOC133302775 isoform X2 [Gastrolobium bilobum]XP_061358582.1 uncharacterized protein LOC133302775 isoform X2 [Gastrolobium bilobum]